MLACIISLTDIAISVSEEFIGSLPIFFSDPSISNVLCSRGLNSYNILNHFFVFILVPLGYDP